MGAIQNAGNGQNRIRSGFGSDHRRFKLIQILAQKPRAKDARHGMGTTLVFTAKNSLRLRFMGNSGQMECPNFTQNGGGSKTSQW